MLAGPRDTLLLYLNHESIPSQDSIYLSLRAKFAADTRIEKFDYRLLSSFISIEISEWKNIMTLFYVPVSTSFYSSCHLDSAELEVFIC